MSIPVIPGIANVLIRILDVFKSLRRIAAFVITGVVFSLFVWVIGIFIAKGYEMRDRVVEVGDKVDQSFAVNFFNVFDKIAYVFPVYEAFFAISFYLIFCGSMLLVHWVLQFWNILPFKGNAGS